MRTLMFAAVLAATAVADYEKSYRAALQLVNRWTQPRPFGAK